jgi:hypothetical protein
MYLPGFNRLKRMYGYPFFKRKNQMVNNIKLASKKKEDIIFNLSINAKSRVMY